MLLKNGAAVLESHLSNDKCTVLAYWEQNQYHPYVTWRTDSQGNAWLGQYYKTIDEARQDFLKRIG